MGEVVVEANYSPDPDDIFLNPAICTKSPVELVQVITITACPSIENITSSGSTNLRGFEQNPQEAWLPITESRNGNTFSVTVLTLCSGIGMQALVLPVAFATLGW